MKHVKTNSSKLFGIALKEYIDRKQTRELLEKINAAYADEPDAAEQALRSKSRSSHRGLIDGEW
ncbi:MAG: hypothetical protein WCL71_10410 [Deltaproteobacteria bacterium]